MTRRRATAVLTLAFALGGLALAALLQRPADGPWAGDGPAPTLRGAGALITLERMETAGRAPEHAVLTVGADGRATLLTLGRGRWTRARCALGSSERTALRRAMRELPIDARPPRPHVARPPLYAIRARRGGDRIVRGDALPADAVPLIAVLESVLRRTDGCRVIARGGRS